MTDPLEFARALIDCGVPVFVAPPDASAPTGYRLPTGWQNTRATPRSLDDWQPGAALAAIGGHGIDFIDVDPRNGGDVAMARLKAQGMWPREYALVATPSGGLHSYVYGLCTAKTKRDGIDLQAGAPDGTGRGFVFLPGTERVSKVDGTVRGYMLAVDRLDTYGMDDHSGQAFLAWVKAGQAPLPSADGTFNLADLPKTALERYSDPVPTGDHDSEGAKLAAALAHHGFTHDDAMAILRHRVTKFVGGDPTKPFTDRDLERWWSGAQKFAGPALQLDDPAEIAQQIESTFVDWHRLLGDDMPAEEWILEPLIAVGRQAVIYSPPKVGKSLLALELAAGIARGVAVVGSSPIKARTVLYLDFENSPADIRDRAMNMGLEAEDLDRLKYASFPAMRKLDTPEGGAELLALAQDVGAEIVIIDTATRTIQGEENANDTWSDWYANTGLRLKRAGIALIRLDHTGKDETRGQRGGSSKASDVDAVWRLSRKEGDVLHLDCDMSRVQMVQSQIVLHRLEAPVLHHRVDAMGIAGSLSTRAAALIADLDRLKVPAKLGVGKAMKLLRADNVTCSQYVTGEAQKARLERLMGSDVGTDTAPKITLRSCITSPDLYVVDPGATSAVVQPRIDRRTGEIL